MKRNPSLDNEDCRALLRRIAQGDRDAFWELWAGCEARVRRLCRTPLAGNPDDIEDAVSGVRDRLWHELPDHAGAIEHFRAWLSVFVHNVCTDCVRENGRHGPGNGEDPSDDLADPEPNAQPEPALTNHERTVVLLRAIDALPRALREPYILRMFRDLSYADIADQLNLSAANARKRVQHAREKLRQSVNDYLLGRELLTAPDHDASGSFAAERTRREAELEAEAERLLDRTSEEIRSRVMDTRVVRISLPSGAVVTYHLTVDRKLARRQVRMNTLRNQIRQHPRGWKPRLELANLLYANGDWDAAIEEYRKVVERRPRFLDVWRRLGGMLHALGRNEEAVDMYGKALAIARGPASVRHLRGLIKVCEGDLDAAAVELEQAIRLDPGYAGHYHTLGHILQCADRPAEALRVYDQALELDPLDIVALTNSHNALFPMGRFTEARQRLERAVEVDPNFVLALRMLASCRCGARLVHGDEGRRTQQLIRRALRLAPDAPDVWEIAALFHMFRGEWDKGAAMLRTFAEEHPRCYEGRRCHAKWLTAAGHYAAAAAEILRALELHQDDYWVYHEACLILPLANQLTELRRLLDDMRTRFAGRWTACTMAGMALVRWFHQDDEGCRLAAEAPRRQPRLPEAWLRYAAVLAKAGRHREALPALERCLEQLPDQGGDCALFVDAAFSLGRSCQALGREETAREWLHRAVARAPEISALDPAQASFWLGKAWEALGRRDQALQAYERALDDHLFYPSRQEAEEALVRLRT